MVDIKLKDFGLGVYVFDGMCGYFDSGGIGIVVYICKNYFMI